MCGTPRYQWRKCVEPRVTSGVKLKVAPNSCHFVYLLRQQFVAFICSQAPVSPQLSVRWADIDQRNTESGLPVRELAV